ncbi:MAG: DUF58 domain-containing protein [Candidatus Latescibacteria bacterium]|jgi:uncharacterized protein (DUF58 family)|nr:DUF58 domain-containing protein [Candidatus Latescibacterota bacterium]MBT4140063.1 DUF58 domain-containing protein [Candidatus Latescibacterota bacterium]
MNSTDYLKPEVVSRLSRLDLVARLVVEGFITGLHQSPYHGFSAEFSEYRQYMPGDALRDLDWKVFGKTDRLYIKQYEEETNLKAYILLDASASMAYGSGNLTKFQYAAYTTAALSQLMLRQRDAVGLITFDEHVQSYLPPRSVGSHLHALLSTLQNTQPQGADTDLAASFHDLAERIKRRGLIIVLSDLFDDPDRLLSGLKHFRHRKHEVVVFHILDPRERDLQFDRETRFVDLESGSQIATEPWHIAPAYQEHMEKLIARFRQECRDALIDYVLLDTEEPFDTALFNYLAKRKRLM